ncbi:hypothetical protein HN011_000029, partial [Eciton burchellii]
MREAMGTYSILLEQDTNDTMNGIRSAVKQQCPRAIMEILVTHLGPQCIDIVGRARYANSQSSLRVTRADN